MIFDIVGSLKYAPETGKVRQAADSKSRDPQVLRDRDIPAVIRGTTFPHDNHYFFSFSFEEGKCGFGFLALATELTASQLSLMKVQILLSLMLSLLALWRGGFWMGE